METDDATDIDIPSSTRAPAPTSDDTNNAGKTKSQKSQKCGSGLRRGFKSGVWTHFLRASDGQRAKCIHCNSLIKTKCGSTTGLLVHLRGKHKIDAYRKHLTKGDGLKKSSNKPTLVDNAIEMDAMNDGQLQEFQVGDEPDEGDQDSSNQPSRRTVLLRPKVEIEREDSIDENSDDEQPGDHLRIQMDEEGGSRDRDRDAINQSYERTDNHEITLLSLQNKSYRELKDLILHLQYKCQATEIECHRVKTKMALLKLAYCRQSKFSYVGRGRNGRISHLNKSSSVNRKLVNHHSSEDDDGSNDPEYLPKR